MGSPCVHCPDKGCGSYHDECPVYQDFVAEIKAINKERQKSKEIHTPYVSKSKARHRSNHIFATHKK